MFGKKAKDKITGFEGIVTARCQYIYGCDQYCLTPIVDEKGELREGKWFDEGRIEVIADAINPSDVQSEKPGCESRPHP